MSQKLELNELDEFTGVSVKRTSWEYFTRGMKNKTSSYFRISKLDSTYYFDLKIALQPSKVFSISDGEKIMLMLDDKTVYKLDNLEYTVSSTGAGAIGLSGSGMYGVNISCISAEDRNFEKLKTNLITKVRIYTTDGYVEDEVKEDFAKKVMTAISLVE
jgi:hypothetical protein